MHFSLLKSNACLFERFVTTPHVEVKEKEGSERVYEVFINYSKFYFSEWRLLAVSYTSLSTVPKLLLTQVN